MRVGSLVETEDEDWQPDASEGSGSDESSESGASEESGSEGGEDEEDGDNPVENGKKRRNKAAPRKLKFLSY